MATCPACGSTDIRRTVEGALSCNACDAHFDATGIPLSPDMGDAPLPPVPWRALAGTAAVLAGVFAAVAWWPSPEPVDRSPPAPEVPVQPVRIDGMSRGVLPGGGVFWLFRYHNIGTAPIAGPAAEVVFLDVDARPIATRRVRAPAPDVLPPGEEVVMRLVVEDPPPHASTRIEPVPATTVASAGEMVQVAVRDVGLDEDGRTITGTLRPIGPGPVSLAELIVVGRRRDGRPVAWADVTRPPDPLPPGEDTPFRATIGRLTTVDAAAWTAHAWGRPVP